MQPPKVVQTEGEPIRAGDAGRVREVPGFWVIPSIVTKEGVQQGSAGRGFKPWSELKSTYKRWEGKPLVASTHRWAGDKRHLVGIVKNVRLDAAKKAVAYDAYFFREPVDGYDVHPDVIAWNEEKVAQVRGGKPLEQSGGFGFIEDPTPGTYKGQSYDFVQRHLDPEHVAVLEGQTGACSVRQGCMIGADSRSVDTKRDANLYSDEDDSMAKKPQGTENGEETEQETRQAGDAADLDAKVTERLNAVLPGLVSKAVGDALTKALPKAVKENTAELKNERAGDERAEDAELRSAATAAKQAADTLGCSIADLPGKVKTGCDELSKLQTRESTERSRIAGDIAKFRASRAGKAGDAKLIKDETERLSKKGLDELVELEQTILDAATPRQPAPSLTGAPAKEDEGPFGVTKDGHAIVKDWSKVEVGWAPSRGNNSQRRSN